MLRRLSPGRDRIRAAELPGPVLAFAGALALELLSRHVVPIPNRALLLILPVVLAAGTAGPRSGLATAAIAGLYAAFTYSRPGAPFSLGADGAVRLAVYVLALPIIVLLLTALDARLRRGLDTMRLRAAAEARLDERVGFLAELRESEERFRQLTEAVPSVFWLRDLRAGRIVYVSPAYAAVWGRGTDSLYADPDSWLEAVHPADRERVRRMTACGATNGGPEEYRIVRPDGSLRWVRARTFPVRDAAGVVYRTAGVADDVTDRRLAESALREREALYRCIVETAREGIWMVDPSGQTTFVNDRMAAMLGYSQEDLLGRPFQHFADPGSNPLAERDLRRWSEGDPSQMDLCLRRRDGSALWAMVGTSPLPGTDDSLTGCLLMVADVTERRAAEEQLRESYRQLRELGVRLEAVREEERGAIAREVHDELGQALTVLKLDLSWLQQRAQPETAARVAGMMASVDASLRAVRHIAAQLRPRILDDLGLAAALEWLVEEFQDRTGVRADLVVSAAQEPDAGRSAVLFRITQEALTNVARHAEATHVSVSLKDGPGETTLEIADDGRGCDPEAAADPSRLGILGMRERAALFGGRLEVASRTDGGTVIRARLPKETDKS